MKITLCTQTLAAATLILNIGCSGTGGLSANSGTAAVQAGTNVQGTGPGSTQNPTPGTQAAWKDVTSTMNGVVNGGVMNSYPLIKIDPVAETIELLIPFSSSLGISGTSLILPSTVTIPGLQGATIGQVTMPDGTSGWGVTIPLKYLLQKYHTGLQPLGTLPNGNPLPYFPSEEIDGLQITLPQFTKYQVTIYVGLKAVGAFVAIPVLNDPYIGFGYNIVNQAKTANVGYVALIPTQGASPAGLYVASQLPASVSLELNNLVSF